jgi:hypothetical protein
MANTSYGVAMAFPPSGGWDNVRDEVIGQGNQGSHLDVARKQNAEVVE